MKKTSVIKRIAVFAAACLLLFAFTGCSDKIDYDKGIMYPDAPYAANANALLSDQYRFYSVDPANTQYWHAGNTHDPVIIKEGESYYAFSTDAQWGATTQKGLHVRKSDDLVHWEFAGTALDVSSCSEGIDYVGYNRDGIKVDFFWAPEVIKRPKAGGGHEFWLFYCLSAFGQSTSYIGMAKSDDVTGPYVHAHEIIRTHSSVGGTPNAIDPAVLVEGSGADEKMWLTYGSWFGGVYLMELNPATGEPLVTQTLEERDVQINTATAGVMETGKKFVPAAASDPAFGTKLLSVHSAEAPHIMRHGDYYYLFVTTGKDLTYDYDVRVFRSKDITGPYADAEGRKALDASSDKTFRRFGNKVTDAHNFAYGDGLNRGWAAIGHCSTLTDGDETYLLSHYRGTHMDKDRFFLGVRKLFFTNGWPVAAANRYAGEQRQDLSGCTVSGTYKVHVLHKEVPNAVLNNNVISVTTKAATITLGGKEGATEGAVSGDYDGNWKFSGKDEIEIKLGNTVYKGIVSPQWSWERNRGTLSISAISGKGEAIWANRV